MTKREPPVVLVPEFVERLPVNSDELVPGNHLHLLEVQDGGI